MDDDAAAAVRGMAVPAFDDLRLSLEEFGLTGHEARVLIGLLVMGSATAPQLARFAGVARANVYRMLEGLDARGLAASQPGAKALWTSPGRDECVRRLLAAEEERHLARRATADRTREMLAAIGPETPVVAVPYVHVLRGAHEVSGLYRRLIDGATQEVLVLNRAPYLDNPAPIPEVVRRASEVSMRALCAAPELEGALRPFLGTMSSFQAAGVDVRVVDEVPVRMAIIDRRHVLTTLEDTADPVAGFPTPLHIEHPGFAAAQVMIFEHLWAGSSPLNEGGTLAASAAAG